MADTILTFKDATPLLDTPDALRAAAREEGFLYFKSLLPREDVLDLRRRILTILDRHGYIDKSADLMEAIGNYESIEAIPAEQLTFCGTGCPPEVYREVQQLELFHRLPHHPNLVNLYQTLFQAPVFPHPRHIARVMMPAKANVPTPSHQDHIHIQGTEDVWTAWVPVGDVPRPLGNLTLIRQSHKKGLMDVRKAEGAGTLETWLCDKSYEWMQGDFEAGDVLTFHSYTVHKSLPPTIPGRVRLSCDFRYQSAEEPIDRGALNTHCDVLDWDEVYQHWKHKALQYYWKDYELRFSEWDESKRWQKEKIC
jgi:hypothetical protein